MKLGYKPKIVILVAAFSIFAFGMFTIGYDTLDNLNQALADSAAQRRLEYEVLVREQRTFEQGKKDLGELVKKPYPPEELFSRDTKVVKEIKLLEETAARFNVDLKLTVSGTAKTAPKVPGVSGELVLVPYVVNLEGSFENLMKYVQESEHLPFVTYTKKFTISALPDGNARMTLNSEFYIKK